MRHYCTYFDHHYLPRGLALHQSLKRQGGPFRLWVLCLSAECRETLTKLALPELELISLPEFEAGDAPLLAAKQNRSPIEYYFTCTPSLPLFIFRKAPTVDLVTYLDGDLYFFADPEQAHAEAGGHSISITPHRFPPALLEREKYGIYNVGWLGFRRDENALACLRWWRDRCLEWCHDRFEPTRFADQKYLDDWPTRFHQVKVLDHPGINLAPWNVGNHRLKFQGGRVLVDGRPLIFYHFHRLKQISASVFNPHWSDNGIKPSSVLRRRVYLPYLATLQEAAGLTGPGRQWAALHNRHPEPSHREETSSMRRMGQRLKLARDVLRGKYLRYPLCPLRMNHPATKLAA